MELQPQSKERPVAASLKATYRALLARGLEAGEAANLTAFLHGLPSGGFRWTLPEVEAIITRRLSHAADLRATMVATAAKRAGAPTTSIRARRSTGHLRRPRPSITRVIDPPKT